MSASSTPPLARTAFKLGLAVTLVAANCFYPSIAGGRLASRPIAGWHLVELNNEPVEAYPVPTLSLHQLESRLSGFAGVNQFSAEILTDGDSFKVGPIRSTKLAGQPERMALEGHYLDALAQTTGWQVQDRNLALVAGDRVLARFTAEH